MVKIVLSWQHQKT